MDGNFKFSFKIKRDGRKKEEKEELKTVRKYFFII